MLERISEKLIRSIAELETIQIKDRSLLIDAKAQGLVLLNLLTKLSEAPADQVTREQIAIARDSVDEYDRAVTCLKLGDNRHKVA